MFLSLLPIPNCNVIVLSVSKSIHQLLLEFQSVPIIILFGALAIHITFKLYDSPSDEFCNIWDDCISERLNSVHPIGNPITRSAKEGLRYIGSVAHVLNPSDIFAPRKSLLPLNLFFDEPLYSFAPIVGNKAPFRVGFPRPNAADCLYALATKVGNSA